MLLGNGLMGTMVWGEGSILRITIGRADFWDHRGGVQWTEEQNYISLRKCLEEGNEKQLRQIFEKGEFKEGEPKRPSILPFGRIELDFGNLYEITEGILETAYGRLYIKLRKTEKVEEQGKNKKNVGISVRLDMDKPVLCLRWPEEASPIKIRRITSWEYLREYFESISIEPPKLFQDDIMEGWVQELPADPALCLIYKVEAKGMFIATERGKDEEEARRNAKNLLNEKAAVDHALIEKENRQWWERYWQDIPSVKIPNKILQFLYDYGMFKYAGSTDPTGVAAGLQGPWIEEYQMPPWSADYHFNINVQMCYWPGYRGNRTEHFKPLWDMIKSWNELLQRNAEMFIRVKDGIMLPHAVDDRCTAMGGFWSGAVDHGSTAWVSQMMFRYYKYTLDKDFLVDTAFPFMRGAMRVFEEMLEFNGEEYFLPVSVSPEYLGNQINAWGRNSSFQLAALHRLLEDLIEACDVLGEKVKPLWLDIKEKLPLASTGEWSGPQATLLRTEKKKRILLWEGQPLLESHRHHSHLAGIYPFDTLDFGDREWLEIVDNTIFEWIIRGMGLWSGWCIPWAAILHTCLGNADIAEYLLETFDRIYTNEGHGTLHDCAFSGFTAIGGDTLDISKPGDRYERMQMDGGMAAAAAVQEMLINTRRGINYLFWGAPKNWSEVSFKGMRTEGAFLVSSERKAGEVTYVKIISEAGGVFRLKNPWEGEVEVIRGSKEAISGDILEVTCLKGETITLSSPAENHNSC